MGDLGQTRVFGQSGRETVVLGLRRRVLSDAYHRLVTGSWLQLCLVFASVYFLTAALLEAAHWGLTGVEPLPRGAVAQWAAAMVHGRLSDAATSLEPARLGATVLAAVDGFVRWAEIVIGAGIVLAKFSLQRAQVLFSQVAVIAPHPEGQALLFRMANQRSGHVIDARASLLLVRNEREGEGEPVRRAHDLPLVRGGTALFEHAWTAAHVIDGESPLRGQTPESLAAAEAELLVTLSGYDEALLTVIHARHVYPARRVRSGAGFAPIATALPDGRRALDYRRFHDVEPLMEPAGEPARRR